MIFTGAHKQILKDRHRFRVVAAGRRFGKTHDLLTYLSEGEIPPNDLRWYIAPTYKSAKRIGWPIIKRLHRYWGWDRYVKYSEVDLSVGYPNGAILSLLGADNEDSLRGVGLSRAGFEEVAYMKANVFPEIVRPMLADARGSAMFIGTPDGMNHFYELWLKGQKDDPEWKSWQFTSSDGGHIPASEIESARKDMDERTFRQEFEATFETLSNRVFYAFDRKHNHSERSDLDPKTVPIGVGMDFNVDYMSAEVFHPLPHGRMHFFDEIRRSHSNTFELAGLLKAKYPNAIIYPDATGKHKTSSSTASDFEILRNHGFTVRARNGNPPVRERVNAANRLLMSANGEVRVTIDINKCPALVADFERVTWKSNGDVNKEPKERTHASDAATYPMEYLFPLRNTKVTYESAW